ncbi:MAG: hypothetical protein NTZ78_03335 [Candidatus Aureabacteria bacterium]|nr:hypothetical protein [Candidatus Auribacterota bacterium]
MKGDAIASALAYTIRKILFQETLIIFALALFAASVANALPVNASFPQCYNFPFLSNLGKNTELQQPSVTPAKIGRIITGCDLVWGENAGWINLRATYGDLKIGSNMLAGWVWLENCGWVCLGEGRPLDGMRYSNRGAYDWGVNNDGKGNLSGYACSEVTGWINFRTGHSRVYLDKTGQFYGYAWGENIGWMHFGPGGRVSYLAKADPGPWGDIGQESEGRLARGPDNSEICGGSVPVTGLNITHERYNKDVCTVCLFKVVRDDFCTHIRCCDTPVYIRSLATLTPIRAPPVGI